MNEIKVFFILLKKLLISPLPIMSRAVLVYKVADEVILREKRLASKVEPARSSQQGRASKVEPARSSSSGVVLGKGRK